MMIIIMTSHSTQISFLRILSFIVHCCSARRFLVLNLGIIAFSTKAFSSIFHNLSKNEALNKLHIVSIFQTGFNFAKIQDIILMVFRGDLF